MKYYREDIAEKLAKAMQCCTMQLWAANGVDIYDACPAETETAEKIIDALDRLGFEIVAKS